jgi:hypothetical protein
MTNTERKCEDILKTAFLDRCQDILDNGYEELFPAPQKSEHVITHGLLLQYSNGTLFPERVGGNHYLGPFMSDGTPTYKDGRRERLIRCLPSAGGARYFLRREP